MLRKLTMPLFLALFGLMSFSAQAGIEQGDKTVSIFGSLQSTDTADTIIALLSVGYFQTDTLELMGTMLLVAVSDDFSDTTVTGFGANANLYLPGQNPDIIPYVGAGGSLILIDTGTFTDSELGINVQAGIKQFISESVTINYQLQFITADTYDATIASIGFTIFLD